MMTISNKVGHIIRVIWNKEDDSVQIVMEITDPRFKDRVLHNQDLQDVITFEGKDVMIVASKSKNGNNSV